MAERPTRRRSGNTWLVLSGLLATAGLLAGAARVRAQDETATPSRVEALPAEAAPRPEAGPVVLTPDQTLPGEELPAGATVVGRPEAAQPEPEAAPEPSHEAAHEPVHSAPAGHGAGAAHAGGGAADHGAEPSALAVEHGSWFKPIGAAVNQAAGRHILSGYVLVSWLVILGLVTLSLLATATIRRNPDQALAPVGLQNFFEFVVEGLISFAESLIGPEGAKYAPLLGTYFIFILCNNWIAVVPGFVAPTSTLNMTLALGGSAFLFVQYYAIRKNGLKGYLLHFAGSPQKGDWIGICLAPLMFVLEFIGECVKPLSLSVRLFGNIFGEDTVVIQIAAFTLGLGGWQILHGHVEKHGSYLVGLFPLQMPMMAFSLFGGLIQALVFTMLVGIYISLLTAHEHEEHHDAHGAAAHAAA